MRIEHKTLIRAPRKTVFQALATGEGLDAWFTTGARLDPRPGGEIVFRWRDWGPDRIAVDDVGRVVRYDPDRRFVFTWGADNPTTVELDLRTDIDGTVVSVVEHGFTPDDAGLASALQNAAGWGEALTLVKFYCESGLRY